MTLKLDIGCGFDRLDGYWRVDSDPRTEPHLLLDLSVDTLMDKQLTKDLFLNAETVDEIRCYDFLEHIPHPRTIQLMEEFWELLVPDGSLDIRVPSTDGRGAWQNPLHVSWWNKNSFLYYLHNESKKEINFNGDFELVSLFDRNTGDSVIHTYAKLRKKRKGGWV